jgi:hypothetical protein
MTLIEQIMDVQDALGVPVDGDAGPVTWSAIHARIIGEPKEEPTPAWPRWANEAEVRKFFTPLKLVQITPPYALRIKLENGTWKPLKTLTCHAKVAGSLMRILMAIKANYNGDAAKIRAAGMDSCGGVYVDRPVIGGKRKSMHGYGGAIDLGVERNQLYTKGDMPPAVIAIFKDEGWRWGGDYKSRKDPMHFEACR